MTYEYLCDGCQNKFEVAKPVSDYNREELCPVSAVTMVKCYSKTQLYNTAVQEPYYSPAHGKWVKGRLQERELAKRKGWIEVGNERPEKHLKPERLEYE